LVSVATLLPLSNLVIKAGWVATSSEEHLERYWSAAAAVQSTILSPFAFSDELMWSLELSASSTALAMIVAIAAIYLCRWRWVLVGIVAVMGFLVASPGPLVNLAVIAMFDWEEPVWVGFLSDRTLVAPIIALQSRCLPIAFAVLGIAMLRFQHRHHTSLQLDRGLPLFARIWILAKGLKGPIMMAAVVVFFVAFAELPCYLLVQPAGVTTVAMRMFELLHYGVKNQEAGLGLFLALASMIPSFWLCRAFDLYRD
jgi:ABC-type Fe3+ transport system permease subunit